MADGDGQFTIRVEGHLDSCAAGNVVERLRQAPDDCEVTIDLGPRVRCDLVALSSIAEAIERRSGRTFLRGLSGHDLRILEYLGVELPAAPEDESP
jgi:hypothetical protein